MSDVDFTAGAIRVERQRLQSGLIGPPRTGTSRRTVPVGEVVTDALLAHLAARPSKEWLFSTEEGEPLNHRRRKTTLRTYAHLWPGEEDRTRPAMDAVLGGLRTGCGPNDQGIKETAGRTA